QLGIERKLFGDILVDEERAQIMINQQFLLLFQDGLKKIGRIPVSLEERPFTEKIDKLEQYRELDLSVSSFRLDVLLSNVLKLSRNQANQLIEKKLVQVNYHV
ncbi:RNA-binding protein, partial [Streptococcus pneumoniae]|nr:RNA-binding protein [Streptococcus pneumoniae]